MVHNDITAVLSIVVTKLLSLSVIGICHTILQPQEKVPIGVVSPADITRDGYQTIGVTRTGISTPSTV